MPRNAWVRGDRRRRRRLGRRSGARLVLGGLAQLHQAAGLHLADALAGEVHDLPHLFERDAALLRHVQRAGVLELPDLLVREVELDGARLGVHIQVEVVLAGDEQARPRAVDAVGARVRAAAPRLLCSSSCSFGIHVARSAGGGAGRAPSPCGTWSWTAAALRRPQAQPAGSQGSAVLSGFASLMFPSFGRLDGRTGRSMHVRQCSCSTVPTARCAVTALPSRATSATRLRRAGAAPLSSPWSARRCRSPGRALSSASKPVEDLVQAALHLVDVVLHEDEGAPDVLEGETLGHHLLDGVDPADRLDRVEALAAAVLALAAHAAAAGQQARLHVLAKGGLGERARPWAGRSRGSRRAERPRGELSLDARNLPWVEEIH